MVVVEATGPNTRMNLDLRVAQHGAASALPTESRAGRSPLVRALLVLAVVATLVWVIAAPSTPALIAVVSAVIAIVGWGDGPDHEPSA